MTLLTAANLQKVREESADAALDLLKKINKDVCYETSFNTVDVPTRQELVKCILKWKEESAMIARLLELVRYLARDSNGLSSVLAEEVLDFVFLHSALTSEKKIDPENLSEADKCLVNVLYHDDFARTKFWERAAAGLLQRLLDFSSSDSKLVGLSEDEQNHVWFFDLRIAFVVTAHCRPMQSAWYANADAMGMLFGLIETVLEKPETWAEKSNPPGAVERALESFKILYNLLCRVHNSSSSSATDLEQQVNKLAVSVLSAKLPEAEMTQAAINLLSLVSIDTNVFCPQTNDPNTEQHEGRDMTSTGSLLSASLYRLEQGEAGKGEMACIGPYLTVLIKLCSISKEARRYCRYWILPPLTDKDVERPPDEGATWRNKIVKLMTAADFTKDLSSEFMFVLCKRSVQRMIKYTGFGHSAGLLANAGLLGQINGVRRASDSEDSETEEYRAVQDQVNPVTGYIRNETHSALDDMSDEQKEYEAMKLMQAMNRLLESKLVKPATIGPDGKPREVSHILELTKNIPDTAEDSDSD